MSDNYPVRLVCHEDSNQADLPELIGAVSRLGGIILYFGITNFFGTPLFLRIAPITNSREYVNEISQRQDYSDYLAKAPCVFARLDD
jgi:hypothetical protein